MHLGEIMQPQRSLERIPDPLSLARTLNEWVERHRLINERIGLDCAHALADEALDLEEELYSPSSRAGLAFWKIRWLELRQRTVKFLRVAPSKRRRAAMNILARSRSHHPIAA